VICSGDGLVQARRRRSFSEARAWPAIVRTTAPREWAARSSMCRAVKAASARAAAEARKRRWIAVHDVPKASQRPGRLAA